MSTETPTPRTLIEQEMNRPGAPIIRYSYCSHEIESAERVIARLLRDLVAARKQLAAKCDEIRGLCDDWAEDHTHAQNVVRKYDPGANVEGDEYGVPGIGDLLDVLDGMLGAKDATIAEWQRDSRQKSDSALALIAAKDAEIARQKFRADNHWETLRSIRHMAQTSGDLARIRMWVDDAQSGYTQAAETTLVEQQDRAESAESRVHTLEAELAAAEKNAAARFGRMSINEACDHNENVRMWVMSAREALAAKDAEIARLSDLLGKYGSATIVERGKLRTRAESAESRVHTLEAELADAHAHAADFQADALRAESRLREVEAERDALRRTLEVPPGCDHAGQVFAHCLACELDAEKTRYLLMSTTATRAANEVDRLRDTLTRIATEIVAVAPDSGKCDSVGEIYHLLRECGAIDALARRHASDPADEDVQSYAPNEMGKEDEG